MLAALRWLNFLQGPNLEPVQGRLGDVRSPRPPGPALTPCNNEHNRDPPAADSIQPLGGGPLQDVQQGGGGAPPVRMLHSGTATFLGLQRRGDNHGGLPPAPQFADLLGLQVDPRVAEQNSADPPFQGHRLVQDPREADSLPHLSDRKFPPQREQDSSRRVRGHAQEGL